MSYRERTAWLSLVAIAVTFGPYFTSLKLGWISTETLPVLHLLSLYMAVVTAQVAILAIGHAVLRLKFPEDAKSPADERDSDITRRSVQIAYYVLLVGMILVGCVLPFSSARWGIVNASIFMIVAAELVRYGVIVSSYRRQA